MPNETETQDYVKVKAVPQKQSNTLGAIGATLGGAALGGVVINGIGNAMSRYLGGIANNLTAIGGVQTVAAPVVTHVVPPSPVANEGGYVSKEVAQLMSENAQLRAERYADNQDNETRRELYKELNNTNMRVCELEKNEAVNKARDEDFRELVKLVYVRQPQVHFDHRVVPTEEHHHHGCKCGCSSEA